MAWRQADRHPPQESAADISARANTKGKITLPPLTLLQWQKPTPNSASCNPKVPAREIAWYYVKNTPQSLLVIKPAEPLF